MAAEKTQEGKVIGNVGVLDIRSATEESVARIRRIGNVGIIIHTPETAHLAARINMGNVGNAYEVPEDARFFTGQTSTNFKDVAQPVSMVVNGQLLIEPDTRAEDVEKGLEFLICAGQVLCPRPLTGVVQSRARDISGQLLAYDPSMQVIMDKVAFTDGTLKALDDGSRLLVVGNLDLLQVVDNDLLAAKLDKIQVLGRITCREENLATLSARLDQRMGAPDIHCIPLGYEPVKGPATIDNGALAALPGRKLYCNGLVVVDAETDAKALDQALDGLRVTRLLIAPASLKAVLASKCNLLETKAIFYEGTLWHIEETDELLPGRFDYLEGNATLVVRDTLTISTEIDAKTLADRLYKIHNFETIACTPEQKAAIQARLGINEGELVDSTRPMETEDHASGEGIGNAGHLKL